MESFYRLVLSLIVASGHCYAHTPLQVPPGSLNSDDTKAESTESPIYSYRIPTDVIPLHYIIQILPVLIPGVPGIPQYDIPGTTTIRVQCKSPTNSIDLHAFELGEITPANITFWNAATPGTLITVETVTAMPENEAIQIGLAESLTVGQEYVVEVKYTAKIAPPTVLDGRMNGLYRTSYTEADGVVKELAVTQFSRTRGFRKLVPSFDEPTHKAVFQITIGRQTAYHTLSNMNRIEPARPIENMDGWFWDDYQPTPVMPPTVLAMVISELKAQAATQIPTFPKPVNIWGPPELIDRGEAVFAAEAVAKTLDHYNQYFEIPYELPKMDSVGVNDFAAGAMENWGLNVYRSAYLFINDDSTTAAKFSSARVISHELAHQWWGNLVTHAWWNDWWLTEGFASFYQFRILHEVFPEYEALNRGVPDDIQEAMEFDITPHSVPIHGPSDTEFIIKPSEIDYSKGSSLVRMMSGFLTETEFKKAVIRYLKKRQYTAVDQSALFEDLQEYIATEGTTAPSNGKEMKEIMDGWTTRTGFPVVYVSQSVTTPNTIYFSQKPFQMNYGQDQEPHWYVPISYISRSNAMYDEGNLMPKVWLNKGVSLLNHPFNTNDWILVNPDARGYYRVLYDEHFASLLQKQLVKDMNSISAASRSQIIDDYLSASLEQYIHFDDADKMISSFIHRDLSHLSWITFLRHFRKVYNLLLVSPELDQLKAYILPKLGAVLDVIGREPKAGDAIPTQILRSELLDWECGFGDVKCQEVADRLFDAWKAGEEDGNPSTNFPVPVDLRPVVYCRALSKETPGDTENWDFLKAKYEATKDPVIRSAFRCTSVDAHFDQLLAELVEGLPDAEAWAFMTVVAGSQLPTERAKVVARLTADLPQLVAWYKIDGITGVFNAMVPIVSDPAEISEIQAFVDTPEYAVHLAPVIGQLQGSIDTMTANEGLLGKFDLHIGQFLPVPPSP